MTGSTEGREQIRAGLALITWSGLAQWDPTVPALVVGTMAGFEEVATCRHKDFGRLMSWVIFAVGCEYLLKGACLVRGLLDPAAKVVLRAPRPDEDLGQWIAGALQKAPAVTEEVSVSGSLGELPLKSLLAGLPDRDRALAGLELLRQSIRNRDAHHYLRNVRAANFPSAELLFVPALNTVLGSLDQSMLRAIEAA